MHKDHICRMATFGFCLHGEKLPWQGWLPSVVQQVTRLSELPKGNEKLVNSYRGETMHQGKVVLTVRVAPGQ